MFLSELVASLPEESVIFFGNDTDISGISSDTRSLDKGNLFICIEGLHTDGHDMISDALNMGASAVVLSDKRADCADYLRYVGVPYVSVSDTRIAEAFMISHFCGDPWKYMKMFAVTGTNGKTTTVSMLEAIYRSAGIPCRTVGTLTGSMTTPDPSVLYPTLKKYRDDGIQCVFMEASSHALALEKLSPIIFDYGIFTNISPEHLDFHRTMSSYTAAKAKLFKQCRYGIINCDDKASDTIVAGADTCEIHRCSAKNDNIEFSARHIISKGIYGIEYDLRTERRMFRIKSPIPGIFTVMNTLEAASTAYLDGIPVDVIRSALCGFNGVKGRLERVRIPTDDFTVYIDFAHTPDALENILRTVRSIMPPDKRLVLLFGCGGDRDTEKRPIMGRIAARLADYLIITSDNSRSEKTEDIISDIITDINGNCTYTVIPNRENAIREAIIHARAGDVILLAGKGHEEYEIMSDGKHPFSEKNIVMSATEEYLKTKKRL